MAAAIPAGVPRFHVTGHSFTEDDHYAHVQYAVGFSRARRVVTAADRVWSINWLLEPAALESVINWHEYTLEAGTLPFVAEVKSRDDSGLESVTARWISFSIQMMHFGRGMVTGSFMEFVEDEAASDDPFIDDVILLLTGRLGMTIDSSVFDRSIYVSNSGGPDLIYTDPDFPLGVYDLTGGRIGNRDADEIPGQLLAEEFTIEFWCKPIVLPPNVNKSYVFAGGFNINGIEADGSFTAGVAIGGNSYTISAPAGSLVVDEPAHIRLTRTNQSGLDGGYLRLYLNGVKVSDSTTFAIADEVNPSSAENRQLGYDETTDVYMVDMRYTRVNRSRMRDSFTPPTPGSLPEPSQPIRPCTWDPNYAGAATLSLSDTLATVVNSLSTEQGLYARPATGNWYFEIDLTQTAAESMVGLCRPGASGASSLGSNALGWGYFANNGQLFHNGGFTAYGSIYGGASVTVGVQLVAGSMVCWIGGVAQGSGVLTGLTGWLLPAHGLGSSLGTYTALLNTAGPFSQALPSGASAWGPF